VSVNRPNLAYETERIPLVKLHDDTLLSAKQRKRVCKIRTGDHREQALWLRVLALGVSFALSACTVPHLSG